MEELSFLNEEEVKRVKQMQEKMNNLKDDYEFKRLCTEMALMIERARNRHRNKEKPLDFTQSN